MAVWDATVDAESYLVIGGESAHYSFRGISNDGTVLLSHYRTADRYFWRQGSFTRFSDEGYEFDLEGLYPVALKPDGAIYGVYTLDMESIHPFSIKNQELSIDRSISLTFIQADEIEDISPNGHVVTRHENLATTAIYGPSIGGVQVIENFAGYSVNDSGYAVGQTSGVEPGDPIQALLWRPEDGLHDLNELLADPIEARLEYALSIQADNSLLALGVDDQDLRKLFLLQIARPELSVESRIVLEGENLALYATPAFNHSTIVLQRSDDLVDWTTVSEPQYTETEATYRFDLRKDDPPAYYKVGAIPIE